MVISKNRDMKKMRLIIVLLLTTLHFGAFAQEGRLSSLKWNVDIANRHVWRGGLTVKTACIKPSIEYNRSNFTAGAWSVYSVDNSYQEIDLYLGYSIGRFNLTVYDFYCPKADNTSGDLFDYNHKSKVHYWDVVAQYKISGDIPLTILGACYIAGDINETTKKEIYSTYFELNYLSKIAGKNVIWAVGMAPGYSSYVKRSNDFSVINIGMTIKDKIKITESFNLPVTAGLTMNPDQERLYLTLGFSLGN